jgi:hypothetical protein
LVPVGGEDAAKGPNAEHRGQSERPEEVHGPGGGEGVGGKLAGYEGEVEEGEELGAVRQKHNAFLLRAAVAGLGVQLQDKRRRMGNNIMSGLELRRRGSEKLHWLSKYEQNIKHLKKHRN